MERRGFSAKELAKVALFVCLIIVCSWITIPFAIPFTLQTFAIALSIAMLGPIYSLFAIAVYVLLGVVGVPVFSGFNGGIGAIMGATGGYIIGFFLTALIGGFLLKFLNKNIFFKILALFIGVCACYLLGTIWFVFVYAGGVGFWYALSVCVLPFIIPDVLKITLAVVICERIKPKQKIQN